MDSTTDGSSTGGAIDETAVGDDVAALLARLSAPRVKAPELMGADELAAAPRPFPPPPVDMTPLVAPPALPAPPRQAGDPFHSLLAASSRPQIAPTPTSETVPLVAAQRTAETPDVSRSTVGEWIVLVLAIIAPPIGVIAAIIAGIASLRRRGWVGGIVKVALPIAIVLSLVLAVVGYFGYKQLKLQQLHDQTAAASAAFCSIIAADPAMIQMPDFSWPAPAASIPESITKIQGFADSWAKLAKVAPPGVANDVEAVASTARQLADAVSVNRTVNDASNVATMTSVASTSRVPAWFAEYCN